LGAAFSVTRAEQKHGSPNIENVEAKHHGTEDVTEVPTSATLTKERTLMSDLPKSKVKADSRAGRFSMHNYMVVFEIYKLHACWRVGICMCVEVARLTSRNANE
jgi:hypothetical protein